MCFGAKGWLLSHITDDASDRSLMTMLFPKQENYAIKTLSMKMCSIKTPFKSSGELNFGLQTIG